MGGSVIDYYFKTNGVFDFNEKPQNPVWSVYSGVEFPVITSVTNTSPEKEDDEKKMLRERLKDAENVIEMLYAGCHETDQCRLFFEDYVSKWKGKK